jgi:hypothetical protein
LIVKMVGCNHLKLVNKHEKKQSDCLCTGSHAQQDEEKSAVQSETRIRMVSRTEGWKPHLIEVYERKHQTRIGCSIRTFRWSNSIWISSWFSYNNSSSNGIIALLLFVIRHEDCGLIHRLKLARWVRATTSICSRVILIIHWIWVLIIAYFIESHFSSIVFNHVHRNSTRNTRKLCKTHRTLPSAPITALKFPSRHSTSLNRFPANIMIFLPEKMLANALTIKKWWETSDILC